MGFTKAGGIIAPLLMALGAVQAQTTVQPIVMKGTKFFYENGTQFFMKGVAYQQEVQPAGSSPNPLLHYTDPLANPTACARDVPLLAALGTNTIRTYAIDPTADHSACMQQLQEAGIYVVADLSEPSLSINRDAPEWNTALFARYAAVVDELSKYPNTIGFFAGNEVSNNASNTGASAYVKAAVRDTKAYIKSKNLGRWMGVGYAANDDAAIRQEIAHYFNCGNQDDAIDYWGYNIYSWCGKSSFQASGYAEQVAFFSNYSVPVFFAEYGCNIPNGAEGRIFDETTALYSDQMTGVISGGIVYMYFQEANDYGLVKVDTSGKATTMKNYDALKTKVLAATPNGVEMSAYTPSNSPAACPGISSEWQAAEALPPTPNTTVCDCMVASLSCVPSASLQTSSYGDLFGTLCGYPGNLCAGINGNASTGVYGAYSMCNDTQKLAYVMNEYYVSQKSSSSACDFKGAATLVSPESQAGTCSAALASATASAAAGSSGSGSGSGSSGSSSGSGSSNSTGSSFAAPFAGASLLLAVAVGAATVFL